MNVYREGGIAEQTRPVLAGHCDMFLRQVEHGGELLIHALTLNRSKPDLADFSASAISLSLDIVSFALHGGYDVAGRSENAVNESVMQGRYLPQSGITVTRFYSGSDLRLQVEDASLAVPSMTQTVDYHRAVAFLFCLMNGLDVFTRVIRSRKLANVVISDGGV